MTFVGRRMMKAAFVETNCHVNAVILGYSMRMNGESDAMPDYSKVHL